MVLTSVLMWFPFYSSTVTFLIKSRVSLEVRHALVVNLLVLGIDISRLLRRPVLYHERKVLCVKGISIVKMVQYIKLNGLE